MTRDGVRLPRVTVQRQEGRVVIGRRQEDRRREELVAKANRTQAETLELILLEIRQIKEQLGIQ